jgi:GMP synthase (glutamine-hydrolysing)
MNALPVIIVKVGSAERLVRGRQGDFEDFFRAGLGLDATSSRVVDPTEGDELPPPGAISAAVVTGSSAMITSNDAWSLSAQRWLADVVHAGRPVLGVCYGHQLLAQALGGKVGWNRTGREIGTVSVRLTEEGAADPLFQGLPRTIRVQATHSQSVLELPAGARLLAENDHDSCQAFRFGGCAYGTQFHPEFSAGVVAGYIEARSGELRREGLDADGLLASCGESGHGRAILARFASLVRETAPD